MIRTYSELVTMHSFEERFRYLKLSGSVGYDTFGFDRYLNQSFYKSREWRKIKDEVIVRDNGCDLGVEGFDIYGRIYIHHMNPITVDDIIQQTELLLNPEYLICTSFNTHQAIHYGDETNLTLLPKERSKNDTCPWKI
jgi:hypothetical protein